MTTNPEQTAPPLSDAEVADLRDWTDSHRLTAQSDAILRLCATVDGLQYKLATARRQRDERPAGRVVWEGPARGLYDNAVLRAAGSDCHVVVLADDGAQSGEGPDA